VDPLYLFDYPPEGFRLDPFDTTVDEPQYIIHAGGRITYAWTGSDAAFDARETRLRKAIEGGRFMLLRTQKIAVAHDGAVVREWPLVTEPVVAARPEPGEFGSAEDAQKVYEERREYVLRMCGHLVIDDDSRESELADRYDRDAALAALRAASSGGGRALALFVYSGVSWW
jgi:hypothetical protein